MSADATPPTVRAIARYVRVAPRKARLVADQVRGLPVPHVAAALEQRPLVPADAEPLEIGLDRLRATLDVPGRIGVVDPQQEGAAEVAVGDRA